MTAQETRFVREFALDVMAGLSSTKKFLHPRYFYDETGSKLFEQICLQPEYYLTRVEAGILKRCSPRLTELMQSRDGVSVIELGSGSSKKTRILLRQMLKKNRVCYVPIDISHAILQETAASLTAEFRGIKVIGIAHDYNDGMRQVSKIMSGSSLPEKKLILFLGSSIGNFEAGEDVSFLRMIRENMKEGDLLLVGFDLQKDGGILNAAYNDKKDMTAQFNLNLLARINNELRGQFDLKKFAHMAFYNEQLHRIEMHIVSKEDQNVYVSALGTSFRFERSETIHTENSYKYDLRQIQSIADAGGLALRECFIDRKKWFCLALLSSASHSQNI